jgi:D-sedoheptulose 7-phosphate isomerase
MNKERIRTIIADSITTKAYLLYDDRVIKKMETCAQEMIRTLKRGGKIMICGNGGSASDSQHFAAEIVGRFQKERRALAAIALTTDTSILTSVSNDYAFDKVFQRQIESLGTSKDLLVAISTSGKATNCIAAVKTAKKLKLKTIALTGKNGGDLAKLAEISIIVPSDTTARIQESHIMIIHILCELIENAFLKAHES